MFEDLNMTKVILLGITTVALGVLFYWPESKIEQVKNED